MSYIIFLEIRLFTRIWNCVWASILLIYEFKEGSIMISSIQLLRYIQLTLYPEEPLLLVTSQQVSMLTVIRLNVGITRLAVKECRVPFSQTEAIKGSFRGILEWMVWGNCGSVIVGSHSGRKIHCSLAFLAYSYTHQFIIIIELYSGSLRS